MSIWVYGFFDNPNHPPAEKELEALLSIHQSCRPGEMVEIRLTDRRDPPGKGARPGDVFIFLVRHKGKRCVRGRAVVGAPCRFGTASPWMRGLYGAGDRKRHWLPFSEFELHAHREPAILGLRDSDLPNPSGQAFIKRQRETDHLAPELR